MLTKFRLRIATIIMLIITLISLFFSNLRTLSLISVFITLLLSYLYHLTE